MTDVLYLLDGHEDVGEVILVVLDSECVAESLRECLAPILRDACEN